MIAILILVLLVFTYLFCIKGRKASEKTNKLLEFNYAHRGLHKKEMNIPENSVLAFEKAVEKGYASELDVHLLADGTLAVVHDSALLRTTGLDGKIEDKTHRDLNEIYLENTDQTLPDLAKVLSVYENSGLPLLIELKPVNGNHNALCEAVAKLLEDYKGEFLIESFDPRVLLWFRKNKPQIPRGQLAQNFLKETAKMGKVMDILLTSLFLNVVTKPDFLAYKTENRNDFPFWFATKVWKTKSAFWTVENAEQLSVCKTENSTPIFENILP